MQFSDYWNRKYKNSSAIQILYDNWLDNYKDVLEKCKTKILDLGCGKGYDSLYLTEKGFEVIASDYSEVAIENINQNIKNIETKLLDISKTLPFEDNSFDVIIANLSLHYFDEKTTKSVMKEIKRILSPKGVLLARVNSTKDINNGAGQGEKIEDNFYFVEGYNKRFFTIEDAEKFFSIIGQVQVTEKEVIRNKKIKKVIEVNVEKEL